MDWTKQVIQKDVWSQCPRPVQFPTCPADPWKHRERERETSWHTRMLGYVLEIHTYHDFIVFTKASEASWSYSCDSKVSFDRVQILTPDFSGRRPPPPLPSAPLPSSPLPSPLSPPHLPSPPPCLPPTFPPSLPPSSLFASSTPSCRRSLACG